MNDLLACSSPPHPTGNCVANCKRYETCTESDKGFFAEVRYFQLQEVNIPGDVESIYLQALILNEETVKEQFLQETQIVQKRTDAQVCVFV